MFQRSRGRGGDGPRATPTVAGNAVYTLGASGLLNCLDAESGQPRWPANDIPAQSGAVVPRHGFAGSPLVVDDLVVVSAGGAAGRSLMAYHVKTGHLIWEDGSDPAGYRLADLVQAGWRMANPDTERAWAGGPRFKQRRTAVAVPVDKLPAHQLLAASAAGR